MIKPIVNSALSQYLRWRYNRLQRVVRQVDYYQDNLLKKLLQNAQSTEMGKCYQFRKIKKYQDFNQSIPVMEYDDIKTNIQRMMLGEKDILWSGKVKWFSKSAGTTSDKSKFIPVSRENLFGNHIKGSWDTLSVLYHNYPHLHVFKHKSLIMGGSIQVSQENPEISFGDISAIMIHHMPGIGRPFYTPDFDTALMSDWEQKIEQTAQQIIKQKIAMFGGVPTWNLVLFKKVLEKTGASNLLDIWPELKVYVHGGVGFDPYREQFKKLIPDPNFLYMEVYNASEGYFAVSSEPNSRDMLILPDNGTFYEFIPLEEFSAGSRQAIPLTQVELGVNYAMVVSTNAGLWRYAIGDTVRFTSRYPFKIEITGRTKQFVNAFGEELMVVNTDQALAKACKIHQCIVADYSVAPIYLSSSEKGGHQWVIEFEKTPTCISAFSADLDLCLQQVNSDYEAKRSKDLALHALKIVTVPKGTFKEWLKSKGRVGGQTKVPRLSNHRKTIEEILDFAQQTG